MKSAEIGKYVYSTKIIGKGSFSRVYKGFNTSTDEIIALKIIEKHSLKQDLISRLHDEIGLMCKLNHPGIVALKDFLENEENFYLVLEYCAGGDLSMLIKKSRIPEDTARKYMHQIVDTLKYLKSRNIIHRDLKPQNILLTADFTHVKLTDFNFARELYDNDLASTLCGSPLYMAPEIIEKHEYTAKSDLWSVGMILYEMVYGKHPFWDAINIMDLIGKIKKESISFNESVSLECNDLLSDLLQIEPEFRCTWDEFFDHQWLQIDAPIHVAYNEENLWESVQPIKTVNIPKNNRYSIELVDNYVPLGITPPKFTQSEPIRIKNNEKSVSHAFSAPEPKSLSDNIWSYMTSSVGIIKGAVDYIAFLDNSSERSKSRSNSLTKK